ncbi:MAG: DNA polymerase III subunit alpha, partial [Saprospiraceae bacterium]|nr:DNA polymerase III subunit alpha [Saprospiraceae bacterium]
MFLNCHTYYSFKYGTLSPEQLAEGASRRGITALALTDINNTSCAVAWIEECRKRDIKPVLGVEFRLDGRYLYTGLAQNAEGWRELCELLTVSSLENIPLPQRPPEMEHVYIIYRPNSYIPDDLRPYEYIGIMPSEANGLYSSILRDHLERLVIWQPITYEDETGYKVHKLMRCVDLNIMLGQLDPIDCADSGEHWVSREYIDNAFRAYPQIMRNTEALLYRCEAELPCGNSNNRQSFTGSERDDHQLLIKLAREGCRRRYGMANVKANTRMESELKVIRQLGFPPYFLITWDIIRYAQTAGYHHVGRGSGANSLVAYCLGITDVDPLELDLYFERFINPHRSSPPDFDIDFSWDERDDVTDYIFKRYGHRHTALLATYNTFKGRSIIRELGKVVGLPKADIDAIVDAPLASDKHHPYARHIFRYGEMIERFPNYLSIHAGGVLVSERPLTYHTALQMMPKGFPITHFDMYHAEDLSFHKYDVLSQRGLGHIKDAVSLVRTNQGKAIDIHDVATIKEDKQVKQQLYSGHCIGCFYIESPAMRGLLTKLHCDNYIHLVAASSIIRPGVAKSGMMREYIKRYHEPEKVEYLHPVFAEHLGETFGVMVYQEDVMKIVHHFAGLDLDESDVLRRIMTGKKKTSDTFRKLMEKFWRNCRQRGYPEELISEVWRQVESFSGYSFCKAHSASFAVESFQSLYLKTYYPLEFMVGVINNFGGFYSTEYYVHEARMCGAEIQAPCINHSINLTTIYGTTIYLGFIHIQSLERTVSHRIIEERMRNGPYASLEDFVGRVDIGREQLDLLIRIGAFRWTGRTKCELMWHKYAVHNPQQAKAVVGQPVLFGNGAHVDYALPSLEESAYDQAYDEIELLGFPLCSPFDLLEQRPKQKIVHTLELNAAIGKRVSMLGYYVTRKPVTTSNGKLMTFGTWLDEQGKYFDTTHFPPSLERYPLKGKGMYLLHGKVTEDFGFASLEVDALEKLP